MKYIISTWRQRGFLLVLIGIITISAGLSSLNAISNSNKITVDNTLQKNWHSQYQIVVIPDNNKIISLKDNLVSPTFLSNLNGGISLDQYNQIKKMKDIDVAAPIANIGYLPFKIVVNFPKLTTKLSKNNIYRMSTKVTTSNGLQKYTFLDGFKPYFTLNPSYSNLVFVSSTPHMVYEGMLKIAGIDPNEENKLTRLRDSIVPRINSRYFKSTDIPSSDGSSISIPVILTTHVLDNYSIRSNIEEVHINNYNSFKKMSPLKQLHILNKSPYKSISNYTYNFTSKQLYKGLFLNLTKKNGSNILNKNAVVTSSSFSTRLFKTTSLFMEKATSPYPQRWPSAYKLIPPKNLSYIKDQDTDVFPLMKFGSFKKVTEFTNTKKDTNNIAPIVIGFYNPTKLAVTKNPLTKLPMGTYRPATAKLVVSSSKQPVNPPVLLQASENFAGFLNEPPMALTTIKAASKILGDKPISAIRLNVKDTKSFTPLDQSKIKDIAQKIKKETGLNAIVTAGSSPEATLLNVPSSGKSTALGWIELPFIHLGATITLFQNTQVSFTSVMWVVLLIAILYVLITQWIQFLIRKRDFAILLALGWKPNKLRLIIFSEVFLLGLISAIISLIVCTLIYYINPIIKPFDFIFICSLAIVIYFTGGILPAIMVGKLKPYETMVQGEIKIIPKMHFNSANIFGMVINQIILKRNRYFLSIIMMFIPTVFLTFFIFVSIKLKGVFYTSYLGQYAALKVGEGQIIAMWITLAIAGLTTVEIMIQNVQERQKEFVLISSLGWRNNSIRRLIIIEGLLVGAITGLLSIIWSILLLYFFHQTWSIQNFEIIFGGSILPLLLGILCSLIPAEIAIKGNAYSELKSS